MFVASSAAESGGPMMPQVSTNIDPIVKTIGEEKWDSLVRLKQGFDRSAKEVRTTYSDLAQNAVEPERVLNGTDDLLLIWEALFRIGSCLGQATELSNVRAVSVPRYLDSQPHELVDGRSVDRCIRLINAWGEEAFVILALVDPLFRRYSDSFPTVAALLDDARGALINASSTMTEPQSEPSLRARLLPGAFFDGKSYLMLRLGNWIESFPLNDKVFPPVALIDSKTLPDGIQKSGVERAVAKLNKALGSGYRICCEFTD